MFNKFTKVFMLVFLLTTQIGESFALPIMPCAEESMMDMHGEMMDHSKSSMTMDKSATNVNTPSDENCCQKDCSCPLGVMTVVLLPESNINSPLAYKSPQLFSNDTNSHAIFLALPQKPPKISFS